MSNKPTRLVLVTNDAERAAIIEQIAVANGWQILPCVRRPVPFELLDHLRIDLFLVDLDLENAFEQVRELARRPGAKVIALASSEKIGNWHDAIQAGAKELVSLPLDPQNLVTTIHHVCNGGSTSFLGNKGAQSSVVSPTPASFPSNPYTNNPGANIAQGVQSDSHFNNGSVPNGNGHGNGFAAGSVPSINQSLSQQPLSVPTPHVQSISNASLSHQSTSNRSMPGQSVIGQPLPSSQPFQHQSPVNPSAPNQPMPASSYPQQPLPYLPPSGQSMPGPSFPSQPMPASVGSGQPVYGQPGSSHVPYPSLIQNQQSMPHAPNTYQGQIGHAAGSTHGYNNGYANNQMQNGYAPQSANRVIAVTGLRGGVGRSTIAVNLAVSLRQRNNASVILVEAHHGLGNLALMLNLLPRHTVASITEGEGIDTDVMRGVLQQHSSGVQLLSAPLDVTQLVEFSPETWRHVLSLLKQMAQYVVIDTSAYADTVLSEVLTAADEILVVCGPDILSMRGTISMLETLRGERDTVRGRVQLLLNRAGVRGGLDESTLQKQLREKIVVSLTDDAPLATYALNRGVPFVLSHGRSALTRSITTLVAQFTAGTQTATAPTPKKPFALLPLLSRS